MLFLHINTYETSIFLLCFLTSFYISTTQCKAKFEKWFNQKSVPADVLDYTLLIFSPYTKDGKNEKLDEILKLYKGKYLLSTSKTLPGSKEASDTTKFKYVLLISRTKNPTINTVDYTLLIAGLHNKDYKKRINIESSKLED